MRGEDMDPIYVSWEEGYDSEWEYTVTIHDNFIHWEVHLDPQWADLPRKEDQAFEDFLKRGPHPGFSGSVDSFRLKEITDAVAERMRQPGYRPYEGPSGDDELEDASASPAASPAPGPDSVDDLPAPPHMKTYWETASGEGKHFIDINATEVVIGSTSGPAVTENATACTHEEFLKGMHHEMVREMFGLDTLKEIIACVKKAGTHEPFMDQRRRITDTLDFIREIPPDPGLQGLSEGGSVIDGSRIYGNAGGYNSELKTREWRFFVDCADPENITGTITELATGKTRTVTFPGIVTSAVELEGSLYISCNDNFEVISPEGDKVFDTALIRGSGGEPVFGSALRVSGTLRVGRAILVRCYWLAGESGGVILRYDPSEKRFIGRSL